MSVRFAGLLLRNPVIAASGTFGYGVEFEDVVSIDRIGGFITKGLSLEPMAGNQAPRLIETPGGMINAIGLQNIGVRAFIEKKLPKLRPHSGTACIANVFGYEIRDYVGVIEALNSRARHCRLRVERLLPQHPAWGNGLWHRYRDPRSTGHPGQGGFAASPDREAFAQRHLHRANGALC